ncbi:hypothetical protein SAMN06265218_109193 [Fodinibius sediminis]|uniref:Uncharacterized protein n=1 Tax=Fodinibius sediminis TaxID=1214077 RepID=A0A521DCJ1_9BACT|nr:hypothetical protein SAMN06265218_109193 [Fodinibius sediminis]
MVFIHTFITDMVRPWCKGHFAFIQDLLYYKTCRALLSLIQTHGQKFEL